MQNGLDVFAIVIPMIVKFDVRTQFFSRDTVNVNCK